MDDDSVDERSIRYSSVEPFDDGRDDERNDEGRYSARSSINPLTDLRTLETLGQGNPRDRTPTRPTAQPKNQNPTNTADLPPRHLGPDQNHHRDAVPGPASAANTLITSMTAPTVTVMTGTVAQGYPRDPVTMVIGIRPIDPFRTFVVNHPDHPPRERTQWLYANFTGPYATTTKEGSVSTVFRRTFSNPRQPCLSPRDMTL